ncbi:MAG: hypothetical protein ABR611_16140 [Chthoniobacterales bacterium]
MTEIGLAVPSSGFAYTLDEALSVGDEIGYPLIVRPSYILGGGGTGIAASRDELADIAAVGLAASPITEITNHSESGTSAIDETRCHHQ